MIKQIKFVSIACEDQQRALEFYTDKLGFLVATDQHFGKGQRWIELAIPGAETGLVLFNMDGQKPGGQMNFSFICGNIDQTYKELTDKGVKFVQPPTKEPWGTYAILVDTEGNQIVMSAR